MCSVDVPGGLKDWVISRETLMKIYPLMSKNYEVGGKFTFPANSKTGEIKRRTSHKKIHTMNGDKDSVQAPLGILNFHTHPISCYLQEDTVWGWPSGEDVRESLLFGLRGSFAHAIPSVEGVYILQTNPCILTSLNNLCLEALHLDDHPAFDELISIYIEELQESSMKSHDFSNYIREKGMSKEELLGHIRRSRESASVDANGRRSRESASVDANGRRNRVSTASQLGIHIIGSEKCPYTIKAEKLLRTRGTPFTKEYYDSIGEALQNTGTKTIPAIYNSGILIGGYDDLHSLLKKS